VHEGDRTSSAPQGSSTDAPSRRMEALSSQKVRCWSLERPLDGRRAAALKGMEPAQDFGAGREDRTPDYGLEDRGKGHLTAARVGLKQGPPRVSPRAVLEPTACRRRVIMRGSLKFSRRSYSANAPTKPLATSGLSRKNAARCMESVSTIRSSSHASGKEERS